MGDFVGGRPLQGLRALILIALLCAGCDGTTGGDRDTTSRIVLLINRASSPTPAARLARQNAFPLTTQQVSPGDPGFITRLEISITAADLPTALTRSVSLSEDQQEEAIVELSVPQGNDRLISITTFNADDIAIFRGETTVNLTQPSQEVVITLVRDQLVPRAVDVSDLQDTAFQFVDDPTVFGIDPRFGPVTLAFGSFADNAGSFVLSASDATASGRITLSSCFLIIEGSTFPPQQGPQPDDAIVLDPCNIDAVDGRLIVQNSVSGTEGVSEPPVPSPIVTIPIITIAAVTVSEGDSGMNNAIFTVGLSAASNQEVQVDFETQDDTAMAGIDYQAANGTLTFAPGIVEQTLDVAVLGNTLDEVDRTFRVVLRNPLNATSANNTAVGTITDDDPPPSLSIADATVMEGDNETVIAMFAVRLSTVSGQEVLVEFGTQDGTALAGSDYETASGILTFAAGVTTQTITVLVVGDQLNEGPETVGVQLTNASNATLGDAQGVGTILDNDPLPTLSISDATVTEGDTGLVTASFTVMLTPVSGQVVAVDFATQDGSAMVGNDYTTTSGTLTFAAGVTTQTITVLVVGDQLNEGPETVGVQLTNASNATLGDAQGVGTILDNDPLPTLSISDATVTEGDTGLVTASFTVMLTPVSGQAVTVDFATQDDSATAGNDYTATSGTLTFAAGVTIQTITVPVVGDQLNEGPETVGVQLTNASNATLGDAQGVGTILDNDPLPTLNIVDTTVTEVATGLGTASFTVMLTPVSGQVVTVDFVTQDDSATAGNDYTVTSGTLTFAAGVATQTITVDVLADQLSEGLETFRVQLSNPSNATLGDAQGVGTISDTGSLPSLSISDVSVTEGDTGSVTASFTVTLTPVSGQVVTADYTTQDGTALAGSDYQTSSAMLTFPAGSTTQTISVAVLGDLQDEASETFVVLLSNPTNAMLADAQGDGTIDDNDPPELTITDATVTEGDATTVDLTFTVNLSSAAAQPITVDFATQDGTALAGIDYMASTNTLTIAAGLTSAAIPVTVLGDMLDEDDRTFFINLSNPTNATLSALQGVGTIVDNDPLPGLLINDVVVTEGNEPAGTVMAAFSVTLSAASGRVVTVDVAPQDDTALAGIDYQPPSTTSLTFMPGITALPLMVPIIGNPSNQPNRNFRVNLSNATNATVNTGSGMSTIVDDDPRFPGPKFVVGALGFPVSVAAADLNGDGLPDLATANLNTNDVSVLLAQPNGTFQLLQRFAVGLSPISVATADLNGDAVPDLVVANTDANTISVLLGNGNGTLQIQTSFATGSFPVAVVVTDLNGDQMADAVTADSDGVSVLLGQGDGTFGSFTSFAGGTLPSALVTGDVNNDTRVDLIAVDGEFSNLVILLGNGDGTFQSPQLMSLGFAPETLAIGDVNGDTVLDLIIGGSDVKVFLGQGGGVFQSPQSFAVGAPPAAIAVVDVNGDTFADILTADFFADTLSVLLGNGNGTFQRGLLSLGVGVEPEAIVTQDLNGDALLDIVTANASSNDISVLFGQSTGTFITRQNVMVDDGPVALAVGDFNGDMMDDLVTANSIANTFSILLGNGNGTFQATSPTSLPNPPVDAAVGLFNTADPFTDIAVVRPTPPSGNDMIDIFLSNGDSTGTFQFLATLDTTVTDVRTIVAADLNGDGMIDLMTGNGTATSVSAFLGNGDGTFQLAQVSSLSLTASDLAIGDVDGDNVPDVVVISSLQNRYTILTGNNNGTFLELSSPLSTGSFPGDVKLANLNGDAFLDLILVINGLDLVSVGLGSSTGFQPLTASAVGPSPITVVVGDVTGDAQPDLIVTHLLGNDVFVLPGNGDGTLQAPEVFASSAGEEVSSATIAIAELNGDTQPDIVTTHDGANSVTLLLHQ